MTLILVDELVKGEKFSMTTYAIDEEQAATVRKIYEMALQGNGLKKIKKFLNLCSNRKTGNSINLKEYSPLLTERKRKSIQNRSCML